MKDRQRGCPSMGTAKKRKSFTPEYRREAAHLVIDTDRTIAAVAAEIRVGAQLLGRWVQQERARIGAPPEAPLDASERAELDRLRQENTELRLDNEFLGNFGRRRRRWSLEKGALGAGARWSGPVSGLVRGWAPG